VIFIKVPWAELVSIRRRRPKEKMMVIAGWQGDDWPEVN